MQLLEQAKVRHIEEIPDAYSLHLRVRISRNRLKVNMQGRACCDQILFQSSPLLGFHCQ